MASQQLDSILDQVVRGSDRQQLDALELWQHALRSPAVQSLFPDKPSQQAKAEEIKALGNTALGKNEADKAVTLFSMALALDPSNAVYYSNRSAAYAAMGNYETALSDAQHVVSLRGDWARGYSRKALAEFHLGRYDEALESYKKAAALEPDNQAVLSALEQVKQQVVALDMNEKGEEAVAKNKMSEALQYFDKALAITPNSYVTLSNRAEVLLKVGQAAKSLEDANAIIRLRPDWFKGYQRRADAQYALGEYDAAAATAATALKIEPENKALQKLVNDAMRESLVVKYRQDTGSKPASASTAAPAASEPPKEKKKGRFF